MYICSTLLFFSSMVLLYKAVKKCEKTVGVYKYYFKLCFILKQDYDDNFLYHHFIQNDINKEIKSDNFRIKLEKKTV
jgi:hypothetical protein